MVEIRITRQPRMYGDFDGPIGIIEETSSDEEVEENSSSRDKLKSIMEYLFENTDNIPEGIYLKLSDKLKDLHESL